ncbi:MAG: EVE domain-containing protein [Chitinophagaceae bacterium]|nr:EVE domain-containing protein [Chitinophagaceae bacterium]
MNYWLMKSEPFVYSYDQLVKDKQTFWDGVRNYQARNNLRAMKKGDLAFFYHSNEGLAIVGIVKIVKEAYPDPTAEGDTWSVVDIKPVKRLKNPVTLAMIKDTKSLAKMQLVTNSRLSVQKVEEKEWNTILDMAG